MGNCCDGADAAGVPRTPPRRMAENAESDKVFAIIGAGPAGLHMGRLLLKKGYKNVILLETRGDNDEAVGKSLTIQDSQVNDGVNDYGDEKNPVIHELGTCYLHPEYFAVEELLKEYDPDNSQLKIPSRAVFTDDKHKPLKGVEFTDWVFKEAEKWAYPKALHWIADPITGGATFVASLLRYNKLHKEVFGEQKQNHVHGFLGKPKNYANNEKVQKLLTMTFLDFLKENDMVGLIPTMLYSQSVQGYGTLDKITAYYGLFWNTPELLNQVIDLIRHFKGEPNVTALSKGFTSLWRNMIKKCDFKIRYNTTVNSINRHLDAAAGPGPGASPEMKSKDCKPQIEINYNDNKTLQCDYLFMACGMDLNLHLLKDVTAEETKVFGAITRHTLCATLFESDVTKEGPVSEAAAMMWPNHVWEQAGEVYAIRNSLRCVLGERKYKDLRKEGKIKKDRLVAYQFLPRAPNDEDPGKLLAQLEKNLKEFEFPNGKVIKQACWDYFPIWDAEGIRKGYPWKVQQEMQGTNNNTFYIGASVCFESVLSVCEYNNELDHIHHF